MTATGAAKRHWSARRYAETARFVPELGAPVVELLAPLCWGTDPRSWLRRWRAD